MSNTHRERWVYIDSDLLLSLQQMQGPATIQPSPYYTGWTAEDEARRLMRERVLDAELEDLARETRHNQS